ncbi:MAG TPA: RsmE family RNA methyltransferase [Candidatus Acidoferrales bacterium]|nr:RsmE family RNA methyltransferase [Candidatus Acidoferrales bacterium]
MRRRFFVDHFESNSAVLQGESADHLGRVLRAEPNQNFELSDGRRVWLAKIESIALAKGGASRIEFSLVEPLPASEPALRIDLLLSIVKFDRFEWCLEKATELGATRIVSLAAARSDQSLLAAAGKRQKRWRRILLESAQQSRRLTPPLLDEIASPEKAFSQSWDGLKIVCSERRDALPLQEALRSGPGARAAVLAIGPEGGWTEAEIAAARSAGFLEASLGRNILRTETAVLASMAILGFALGEGTGPSSC